jgi:hypothetical protein
MAKTKPIRINDLVEVTFAAHGLEILMTDYNRVQYRGKSPTPPNLKQESDGVWSLRDQLWEVLRIFGPHCGLGKEAPITGLRLVKRL